VATWLWLVLLPGNRSSRPSRLNGFLNPDPPVSTAVNDFTWDCEEATVFGAQVSMQRNCGQWGELRMAQAACAKMM